MVNEEDEAFVFYIRDPGNCYIDPDGACELFGNI
jgi:hypothetical protein